MHFNDKQKKIICLVIAVAMVVPIAIGVIAMFVG
jgi:flagellar basal body-associated protein FliL